MNDAVKRWGDRVLHLRFVLLLALRYGGTLIGFVVGLLIARSFGAAALGVYYLVVSLIGFCALVTNFGFESYLTRLAGKEREIGKIRRVWLLSMVSSASMATLLVVIGWFSYDKVVPLLFHTVGSFDVFLLVAVAMIPMALIRLGGGVLRGLKRPASATLLDSFLLQLVTACILVLYVLGTDNRPDGVPMAAYAGAVAIIGLLMIFIVSGSLKPVSPGAPDVYFRNALSEAWPLFGVSLVAFLINWTSSYMLAAFMSEEEVGIYNVCWRAVTLVAMMMVVINNINAPYFSRYHSESNFVALESRGRQSAFYSAGLGLVGLGLLILFNEYVLGLFGDGFIQGGAALVVLAIGQLVSMSCGSVGYLLMMSGHGRYQRNINIATLIAMVIAMPVLIEKMGMLGAAIGTAATIAVNNILAVVAVRYLMGIQVFPFLPARLGRVN